MTSLYVHIPFCEKKCMYCDFYSIENRSMVPRFISAVLREIGSARQCAEDPAGTLFFGGGTPSLLHPDELSAIMSAIRSVFRLDDSAEITMEMNPGTVTQERFATYRSLGINRVSLGVQSFDDGELRFLERIHTADDAERAVTLARTAGFDNISVDLIYSIPGQTLESWTRTLMRAMNLHPDHISAYSLIIEENTPLARRVQAGEVTPNGPDVEAEMYEFTMAWMADHGFEHYEVSNYARPGFQSRHNASFWNHANYLGFGPSAHSFWRARGSGVGERWWNVANITDYCKTLEGGGLPHAGRESVGPRELANEQIFLGLRSGGLDPMVLERESGQGDSNERLTVLKSLLSAGLVRKEAEKYRLTPAGYLLCDEIAARLML
jgi:oxygen-independent coproporphyrinogen-3 oxidase